MYGSFLLFTSHPPHIWLQSEIVHAMKSEMIAKYPNSWEFGIYLKTGTSSIELNSMLEGTRVAFYKMTTRKLK